jgi:hypothetical protein
MGGEMFRMPDPTEIVLAHAGQLTRGPNVRPFQMGNH